MRAFYLTGSGNQTRWDMLRLLVQHWDRLEELARRPGPFIYAVTGAGLRRVDI